jgi:glycosyltransferase involved in cell wall biosynthesis
MSTAATGARARRTCLLLDVEPLLDYQWTGIPVFTRRLIEALLREGTLDLRFTLGGELLTTDDVQRSIKHLSGASLRESLERRVPTRRPMARRGVPTLFPSVKSSTANSGREASTVHDLSTLFMPETHEDANVTHHLRNLAQELASDEVVFCVSEATKAALTSAFPSAAAKLRVLYQYAEWPEEFESLDRNLPELRLGRYAVVVGTIEPRKNLALLLDALANREIARSDIRFVVIGRTGWLMDQFMEKLTARQRRRVSFTGFVSEFTKYRLIKHAEFLVYPSLYEGFGIPALEAMSLGKPVLAARTSSFPEIVAEAGVYFDPLSVAEFAEAFQEIQHPGRLAELAPKARARAQAFHWRRMAEPVVRWVRER